MSAMQCTLVVEGNAYEKGNESSFWIVPGLSETYCEPQSIEGAIKIFGPCEHIFTMDTKDPIAKFGKREVNASESVDD